VEELNLSYTPSGNGKTLIFDEEMLKFLEVVKILFEDVDLWDSPGDLERFTRDLCQVWNDAL